MKNSCKNKFKYWSLRTFWWDKNKANKDYLTGLFNRRYLFDVWKQKYEDCKINDKIFAIAIIDIDNFKNINDTYGHDVGDMALKKFLKY